MNPCQLYGAIMWVFVGAHSQRNVNIFKYSRNLNSRHEPNTNTFFDYSLFTSPRNYFDKNGANYIQYYDVGMVGAYCILMFSKL